MEQGKHTPIPWRYQTEVGLPPGMPRIRRAQIYTASGKYGHAATCYDVEDAEFITRACNAYYDLLKANKDALSTLEALCSESEDDDLVNQSSFVLDTLQSLRAAISKAEGQKAVAS